MSASELHSSDIRFILQAAVVLATSKYWALPESPLGGTAANHLSYFEYLAEFLPVVADFLPECRYNPLLLLHHPVVQC